MAKTTQCLKMNVCGAAFCCTFTPSKRNPYRLYRTWYDCGNHRKLLAEYANFESVLYYLLQMGLPEFSMLRPQKADGKIIRDAAAKAGKTVSGYILARYGSIWKTTKRNEISKV